MRYVIVIVSGESVILDCSRARSALPGKPVRKPSRQIKGADARFT